MPLLLLLLLMLFILFIVTIIIIMIPRYYQGDVWVGEVNLPKGGVYEYKYILCEDCANPHDHHIHYNNNNNNNGSVVAIDWQRGNNQVKIAKMGVVMIL